MLAGFPTAPFRPAQAAEPSGQFNNGSNAAPSYVSGSVARNAGGAGTIASERVLVHTVRSPFFTGPLRSPARLQNTFAHECFLDEVAAHVKADPVAYRLRHLRDPRLKDVVAAAAKAANWAARPSPRPGLAKTGVASGRGFSCVVYEGDNGYIAMVAEVDVDQATGKVIARRLVVAQDCGPVSNPDGMRNQLEGGALQGLSRALGEEVTWDDRKVTSVDWRTYHSLPLGFDVPIVESVLINRTDVEAMRRRRDGDHDCRRRGRQRDLRRDRRASARGAIHSGPHQRGIEGTMMNVMRLFAAALFASWLVAGAAHAGQAPAGGGRGSTPEPGPSVTVRGHTFTQESLFRRNVGGPDDMTTPFPPHKVIGNIYYVGTKSLAVFLIVTPQGNILINSTYERNVPGIQKSIEQLGFKFSDTKILLGSHAHGDHQQGDALVKELTGAQVMALAEDVPALRAMQAGRQAASHRQGAAGRRQGDPGRHDARRAPDAGPQPRMHDLDDEGAGRRKELRRGDHRQLRHESGIQAGEQHRGARHRRRVQPHIQVARSLPCDVPLGRTPACTTWKRSTRSSGPAARSLHRSGRLQARSRHR